MLKFRHLEYIGEVANKIDYEADGFVVWQWQREHLEPCHRLWEMFPRTARLSLRYYGDLPGRQQQTSMGKHMVLQLSINVFLRCDTEEVLQTIHIF